MSSENTRGRIVLLNGVSSSGKTTIAKNLQEIMDSPYLIMGLDKFYNLYTESFPAKYNPPPLPKNASIEKYHKCEIRNRRSETFHHFIAAFSIAGNDIIVDTVFDTKQILEHGLKVLHDFPVLLVGVKCPLEELERREKTRENRKQGLAKIQYNKVHTYTIYDLEVDTSKQSPFECAKEIKKVIETIPKGLPSEAWKSMVETNFQKHKKT